MCPSNGPGMWSDMRTVHTYVACLMAIFPCLSALASGNFWETGIDGDWLPFPTTHQLVS